MKNIIVLPTIFCLAALGNVSVSSIASEQKNDLAPQPTNKMLFEKPLKDTNKKNSIRLKGKVQEWEQNASTHQQLNTGTMQGKYQLPTDLTPQKASINQNQIPLTIQKSIISPPASNNTLLKPSIQTNQTRIQNGSRQSWDEIMAFKHKNISGASVVTFVALLGAGTSEDPDGQYFINRDQWDLLTAELREKNLRNEWDQWANNLSSFLFDRWTQMNAGAGHIRFRLIISNDKFITAKIVRCPYSDKYGTVHGLTSPDDQDGSQYFKSNAKYLLNCVDHSALLQFPTDSKIKELQIYVSFSKAQTW